MIFKDIVFQEIEKHDLYKEKMNGLDDPTLKQFHPLALSCTIKEECKKDWAEKEFIQSYLQSAKVLGEKLKLEEMQLPGVVFKTYSLSLPAIYLCRHCVELSIKHTISMLNKPPKKNHGLKGLWNALRQYIPQEKCSEQEISILNGMSDFINVLNDLDDNGSKLRYADQTDGTISQNAFIWVNTMAITDQTEVFIEQLELLDVSIL